MAVAEPLTVTHRDAQLVLRAGVLRDLQKLWPAMDWDDVDRTFPLWLAAVTALIGRNRARSAALAASYLRAFRFSQGLTGETPIELADRVNPDRLRTSMEVTARHAIKAAAVRGIARDQAMANAFVTSSGAISRLVLEGGRETVVKSVAKDSKAAGWQRATGWKPCKWCLARSGRRMSSSEVFAAHDHCACTAQPVYR